MTNRRGSLPPARTLTCARCGAAFGCDPGGACWCMDEAFTLPMPVDGGDCLCPKCLRAVATTASSFRDSRGRL